MKKSLASLAALTLGAALLSGGTPRMHDSTYEPIQPLTTEEKEERLRKYYLSKGLKQFNIDGVWIWARNRKNAERKAKNKSK